MQLQEHVYCKYDDIYSGIDLVCLCTLYGGRVGKCVRFGRRGEGSVGHLHIRVMEREEATLVDGLEARGLAGAVAIQRLCVSVRVYVCMCIHVRAVCVCVSAYHII